MDMQGAARKKARTKLALDLERKPVSPVRVESHVKNKRFQDVLILAEKKGLLGGARTKVVRGRMPEALVNKAKARTGIQSDTDLLEVALANLAVADDYPEWLLSHKGTIDPDIDLEF